jgi:ribonucleoside-diphosphate reductase alpha chain
MPLDRYNKNLDKLFTRTSTNDWKTLKSDILNYGLRNSVLSAIMPAESSAVVQNATNGIEPIRSIVTTKRSKGGLIKQVAPESTKLKNKYHMLIDICSMECACFLLPACAPLSSDSHFLLPM